MLALKTKLPQIRLILVILVMTVTLAGATYALLATFTREVNNTFTIGDITLTLTDGGEDYRYLTPGRSIERTPRVTVAEGSEPCWLFVRLDKTAGFDEYLTFTVAEGWTRLGGYEGLYYREVDARDGAASFGILAEDAVTVREDLTAERMSAVTAQPMLTFSAYAIQKQGIDEVGEAWIFIRLEVEE